MSEVEKLVDVDIVSDVVCPWCVVGYRQLKIAAQALNVRLKVNWHPFQLNPQMVPEGQNLREHLIEKYGISIQDSVNARENLQNVGQGLDFEFNFTDDSRIYNTFAAHRLLTWAKNQGLQDELKQALFHAYFTEQRDVSNIAVLKDVAISLGLDDDKVSSVLDSNAYSDDVKAEVASFQAKGISGVPAMIFNHKYLVTGAQGEQNYTNILTQLTQ